MPDPGTACGCLRDIRRGAKRAWLLAENKAIMVESHDHENDFHS
jgi:hypothetical protein